MQHAQVPQAHQVPVISAKAMQHGGGIWSAVHVHSHDIIVHLCFDFESCDICTHLCILECQPHLLQLTSIMVYLIKDAQHEYGYIVEACTQVARASPTGTDLAHAKVSDHLQKCIVAGLCTVVSRSSCVGDNCNPHIL